MCNILCIYWHLAKDILEAAAAMVVLMDKKRVFYTWTDPQEH